ncbi:MAG: hypothetical protein ACRDQJ_17745, partial [Pseudonocardiaceae bacterium]
MTAEPHTYFAPTGAGGVGHRGVSSFYKDHFIGTDKWPADWKIHVVSRTVGKGRLVEEFIVSFTHDFSHRETRRGAACRRGHLHGRQDRQRAHLLGPGLGSR